MNTAGTAEARTVVTPIDLRARRGSVQLRGWLSVDWAARLSWQLAREQVAVRSLVARRSPVSGWLAELDMASTSTDLHGLDLLGMLERAPEGATTRLHLTQMHVERRADHGGCLLLTVEGSDRLGFLATILHALAFQSLFPVEIQARTFAHVAVDRFWVQGLGYRTPPEDAEVRLQRAMDAVRVPPAAMA